MTNQIDIKQKHTQIDFTYASNIQQNTNTQGTREINIDSLTLSTTVTEIFLHLKFKVKSQSDGWTVLLYLIKGIIVLYMRMWSKVIHYVEQTSLASVHMALYLCLLCLLQWWKESVLFILKLLCRHTSFIIRLQRRLCERFGKQFWTCCCVRKWPQAVWYQVRWP